ncbi:MAG: ABC transporter substrate-binding protein [Planctomycetaceae bacterium]
MILCCLIGMSLAGCDDDPDPADRPADVPPFQGVTLRIAIPKELNLPERWEIPLDEWGAQTGARYELIEYSQTGETKTAVFPDCDLAVFPLGELAAWRDQNRLASMPRELKDQLELNWLDVLPGLRAILTSSADEPFALPISAPVLVCYYRRDLLEQAGFSPPKTWDDYEKLVNTRDRWAPNLTIEEPWHPHWRATMFLSRAASVVKHPGNIGILFDINDGLPLIDNPGYTRVLDEIVQGLAQRSPDVLKHTPTDCRNEMLAGKAALAIGLETLPQALAYPFGPETSGSAQGTGRAKNIQIGISPLPGVAQVYNQGVKDWESLPDGKINAVSLTGFCGLGAGVAKNSDAKVEQAAWNLIGQIAVAQLDNYFEQGARSICRESDILNTPNWGGDDLSGEEQHDLARSIEVGFTDQQTVAELPVVGREEFRNALNEGITAALEGESPPASSLAGVAAKWQELIDKLGADQVRDSYRQSLGLTPIKSQSKPTP